MWDALKQFFTGEAPAKKEVKQLSNVELKQSLVKAVTVDNPRLIHVYSDDFVLPSLEEIKDILRNFPINPQSYSSTNRCIHYALRMAARLGGHGWPVGILAIDHGRDRGHAIVAVLLDTGWLFIESQTAETYPTSFTVQSGFFA